MPENIISVKFNMMKMEKQKCFYLKSENLQRNNSVM